MGAGDSVRNNKMARRLIVVIPKQKNDMSMFDRNIWRTRRGNGGLPERTQPHACDGDEG